MMTQWHGKRKTQIHDVIVKSESRIGHSTPHIHENEDIREAFGGRETKQVKMTRRGNEI